MNDLLNVKMKTSTGKTITLNHLSLLGNHIISYVPDLDDPAEKKKVMDFDMMSDLFLEKDWRILVCTNTKNEQTAIFKDQMGIRCDIATVNEDDLMTMGFMNIDVSTLFKLESKIFSKMNMKFDISAFTKFTK